MRTSIIKIGNSQGIRIPKILLEQSKLTEEVELEVKENSIVIRAVKEPRADWDTAFKIMAERGDDELLDKEFELQTTWEESEWEW